MNAQKNYNEEKFSAEASHAVYAHSSSPLQYVLPTDLSIYPMRTNMIILFIFFLPNRQVKKVKQNKMGEQN